MASAFWRTKRGSYHDIMNTTRFGGNKTRASRARTIMAPTYNRGAGKSYNSRLKRSRRFSAPSRVRPELKFHDVNIAGASVPITMVIRNLGIIPQGVTESDRVGRKVRVKNVYWTLGIELNATTNGTLGTEIIRVMLVQDAQTNGAIFAATDIWETDNWFDFRNLAETGRFRVLMRREFTLTSPGFAGNGTSNDTLRVIEPFIGGKRVDIKIQWDDSVATGAIGSCRTNNLYLVTQAVLGTGRIEGNIRVRFIDE